MLERNAKTKRDKVYGNEDVYNIKTNWLNHKIELIPIIK